MNHLSSAEQAALFPVEFSSSVYNPALVHQVVNSLMAQLHYGTRAQKTRAEVSGGGRKPWRQKGTGRARAGSLRSPLWRGGGITFAARPQQLSRHKINRKMYRGALRCIVAEMFRQKRLQVIDSLQLAEPRTKAMIAALKQCDIATGSLLVDVVVAPVVRQASGNIPYIELMDVADVNPIGLLRHPAAVFTAPAVKSLVERLI